MKRGMDRHYHFCVTTENGDVETDESYAKRNKE